MKFCRNPEHESAPDLIAILPPHVAATLRSFRDFAALQARLNYVLSRLPSPILKDLDDPHFRISLDQFEPGKGRTVLMPELHPTGRESRCVVLKPRLATCNESFSHYIIAHELAHAVLRNQGSEHTDDREEAADHLAESWGFPKPESIFRFW